MELEELLAHPPQLHLSADGGRTTWTLATDALEFLDGSIRAGMSTLETGCGVSTLLFADRGANHSCIAPWAEELENIKEFCKEHSISLTKTRLINGRSEKVLPGLDPTPLDLALIDGRHAFPTPFIDWYYISERLLTGGILIVDNTELRTGRILQDFMEADPVWELVEILKVTAVFRKVSDEIHRGEWDRQPWMTQ